MIRIRLAIVSFILTFVVAHAAVAQSVNLSLNVQYTNPANPALGGAWTLVARTDSPHGISSIHAILSNINATGITAQTGIGAVLNGGTPYVNNNNDVSVEVLYFQDLASPANVVTNVGRGAGTPGNLAVDFLNDPQWNNSARIFFGTFSTGTPAFTTNADIPPDVTDANVLSRGVAPFTFASPASITTIVRNNLNVSGDDTWDNSSGNGLWSDAVNWADNSEPGAAQTAIFPAGFPNGDITITLAAGETARHLTFQDGYTLVGGTLTLSGPDSVLHVAAGKTAAIFSALTASGNLQLSGGGNAVVSHARAAGALHVLFGSLKVAPNGTDAGTSDVGSLVIAGATDAWTAKVDIANNDLIIRSTPLNRDADYARTLNQVKTGLAEASGNFWSGNGITSSTAATTGNPPGTLTAVGVILNDFATAGLPPGAIFTQFSGRPVTQNDVLVKYTWFGDADLSGVVDGTDYFLIDQAFTAGLLNGGWLNGDFNYSGNVDGTDYFLIDQAFNAQTGALSARSVGTSVPEPSALVIAAVGMGFLSRRRKRA